eukprot:1526409-Amphidinium_carterae.1
MRFRHPQQYLENTVVKCHSVRNISCYTECAQLHVDVAVVIVVIVVMVVIAVSHRLKTHKHKPHPS